MVFGFWFWVVTKAYPVCVLNCGQSAEGRGEHLFDPRRGAENDNCRMATATSFCPRRAAKGHGERQLQNGNGNFFLSTKGREGARRTATAERQRQLLFVHEGPRRGTKNGNCRTATATATADSFCPRRAAKGHEERQLQDGNGNGNCRFFLSTKGREGAGRTATAERQRQLLFVHEGPRRGAENGNCRTATATSFCPRRAAKGHEERQLQDGNGSFFLSTKGHGERQLQNGNGSFFLSTKGREGARRTATAGRQRQLLFVREGPRRGTKNGNGRTATATSFCPRRAAENTVLWSPQTVIVELETWARKAPALPAGVMN